MTHNKTTLESYRVTTRHPESRHGIPVLLCEEKPVSMAKHLNHIMQLLGVKRKDLADMLDCTTRYIDHFRTGRALPSAAFLNLLGNLIEDAQAEAQ